MPNKAGLLSRVTTAIAEVKDNITAICAYEQDRYAHFVLITDCNANAKKPLVKLTIQTQEYDIDAVEMPNMVGKLQKAA